MNKNPLERLFEDFPQEQYGTPLEDSVRAMPDPLAEFRDGYFQTIKDKTFLQAEKFLRDKYVAGPRPMLKDQLTALILYTHDFPFFNFRDFVDRELNNVPIYTNPILKELRAFLLFLLGGLRRLPRLRIPCTVYHTLHQKDLVDHHQRNQGQDQNQTTNIFTLNHFAVVTPENAPLHYPEMLSSDGPDSDSNSITVIKISGYLYSYCIKEFTGRAEFMLNPSLNLRITKTGKVYPKNRQLSMVEAAANETCNVLDAQIHLYENTIKMHTLSATTETETVPTSHSSEDVNVDSEQGKEDKSNNSGPALPPECAIDEAYYASKLKVSSLEEEYRTVPKTFYVSFFDAIVNADFGSVGEFCEDSKQKRKDAAVKLLEMCKESLSYLKSNNVLEKYSMCDEDAMSISLFTLDSSKETISPHSTVNELLTKRGSLMNIRGYLFYLLNALRKIPPYSGGDDDGPLYRGVCGLSLNSYAVGQRRTWTAFTSTYMEESLAEDRLSGPNQVLFEINGNCRAYNIKDFSIYRDEVVLIEPDTIFDIKEIRKESPNRTRVIVEVQERAEPVLDKVIKTFISNKPTLNVQRVPPVPKVSAAGEVPRDCLKEFFCTSVLTEDEFESITPFSTQALFSKVLCSKASQATGFAGYMARNFLNICRLYFKRARAKNSDSCGGNVEESEDGDGSICADDECKTFIREMLSFVTKAHSRIYTENRIEIQADLGVSINSDKSAMDWAKYISKKLAAALPPNTFAYNGACTYKSFYKTRVWMVMYAKSLPTADTIDAINRFTSDEFKLRASEFSLVMLGFSVPNVEPFNRYDVCPSVTKAVTASFGILPENVCYVQSSAPDTKSIVLAMSTRNDADIVLRNSNITLAGNRCKIAECPTLQVVGPIPDIFWSTEFDAATRFITLSRGERDGCLYGTMFDEAECERFISKVPNAKVCVVKKTAPQTSKQRSGSLNEVTDGGDKRKSTSEADPATSAESSASPAQFSPRTAAFRSSAGEEEIIHFKRCQPKPSGGIRSSVLIGVSRPVSDGSQSPRSSLTPIPVPAPPSPPFLSSSGSPSWRKGTISRRASSTYSHFISIKRKEKETDTTK